MIFTVRQARTYRDLTQDEIAERLGISKCTYLKYEKHPEQMRGEMMVRFAEVVGFPLEQISFAPESTKSN